MEALSRKKGTLFLVAFNLVAVLVVLALGEFAMRWRFEGGARSALRSFRRDPAPSEYPSDAWLVYDPELGYRLNPARPGVNGLGIRHPPIVPEKPPSLFRVIVLGDSVAFDDPGFVTQLRDQFRRLRDGPFEVINASIPGYTTYQERRLLERDLLGLKPDLVLLQYCLNDNHRFLHRLDTSGRWLLTQEAKRARVPEGSGLVAALTRSSYLVFGIRLSLLALAAPRSEFPWEGQEDFCVAWQDRTWPEFEEHLRAMQDQLTRIGSRLGLVMVPYGPQLDQRLLDLNRDYTLKPQHRMREICAKEGVPLLDLHPSFLANRHQGLYRDSLHLSPAGHELTAMELESFLRREGLAARRNQASPS